MPSDGHRHHQIIWKEREVFDKYGTNLAAATPLGGGHRLLHNQLQLLLQAMMKLEGIFLEQEAVNYIFNKIGDPYISQYVNHVSSVANSRKAQRAIVPDLHAHNFPVGTSV